MSNPQSGHMRRCAASVLYLTLACAMFSTGYFPPAVAASDDALIKVRKEITLSGTGLASRAAAIQDAEHAIVADVLKAALAGGDLTPLNPLLEDPGQYIRSTQLVRYDTTDNATHVEVECYVRRKDILKDAAAMLLPKFAIPPTVLVLIAEKTAGDRPLSVAQPGRAETAIADALRKLHLVIADSALVRASHAESDLLSALEGNNDAAGAFARQGFADVVVLGIMTAAQEPETPGKNLIQNTATVTLRVLRASDGRCLDTVTQEAVVHSADPAEGQAAAAEDACAKLVQDVHTLSVIAVAGARPAEGVLVTLEQPGSRACFDAFTQALSEAAGGAEVQVLFYSDALARVRVAYTGRMTPFVDRLCAGRYDGLAVRVAKAVERTITFQCIQP